MKRQSGTCNVHPLADLIVGDARDMCKTSRVGGFAAHMLRNGAQLVEPMRGTLDGERLYALTGELGRYYFGSVCASIWDNANNCPIDNLNRAQKMGHALVWCSQTASCLDGTVKTVKAKIDTDRPIVFMGHAYVIVRGGNNTPRMAQIDARRYLDRDTRGEGPRFQSREATEAGS